MEVNLKKEQRFRRMGQALKNNLKKRKAFQDKVKKKIITSREKEFISLMVIFGQIRLLQNISSKLNFAANSEIQKLEDKFFQ